MHNIFRSLFQMCYENVIQRRSTIVSSLFTYTLKFKLITIVFLFFLRSPSTSYYFNTGETSTRRTKHESTTSVEAEGRDKTLTVLIRLFLRFQNRKNYWTEIQFPILAFGRRFLGIGGITKPLHRTRAFKRRTLPRTRHKICAWSGVAGKKVGR